MSVERRQPGRPFLVLCAASLLFYVSFQLILPIMPLYAASLGGREAQVGLIIGVFAFAAMLPRPLAGGLADRIGRRPLVLAGAAIFALAPLGYAAAGSIAALLALRFLHGVGMGVGPTGATVVVADLAPPERRGAAMGIYGLTMTGGLVVAPYLGIELLRRLGFTRVFVIAAALALASLALALVLPETRPAMPAPAAAPVGRPWDLGRLFSRAALYPSLILLLLYFGYGGVMSFLPLFAERRGLGNPGLFFTAFAAAVIAVRWTAGHLADRFGRRMVVAPALALAGLGLVVLAAAHDAVTLALAAVLYGLGFGAGQPALMAMTTDRARPEERGRAMGTLFTAWELGISAGSVLLGAWAGWFGYPAMWWSAAVLAWAGGAAATRDITRARG